MPTDRPTAVLAMGAEVAEALFPPGLRRRLTASFAPDPVELNGSLTTPGARAALAGADILITGWRCPPLTAEVLAAAPRLRAVIHAAGTVKSLVTQAVWERGVAVSSAADANARPVADFTVAAITLAAKKALPTAARYRDGWPSFAEREGAYGRSVGIIGASRIGRRVIARLASSGNDTRILLSDPYVSRADAEALGARLCDLDELCRSSSIVSVHAPKLPETHQLLDARRLALVPDGGTVINTSRGTLVDTEALAGECATGRLNAFLDVTDPEPLPPGHALLKLPNVLVTPHIAGAQGSEVSRLGLYAIEEAERWIRGEPLHGAITAAELTRLA
ncbi:hydroxyacid dehydrogenase [Streptomyces sp. NPDC057137]|uniref:hydroxyacid dehydrogenase n=1 Tax=Streptomyces sp. NPDC057137 TaxID=3346030 RepID=UPI00362954FF